MRAKFSKPARTCMQNPELYRNPGTHVWTPDQCAIAKKLFTALRTNTRASDDEICLQAASTVAAFAEVRHALLRKQRNFAEHPPNKNGSVLDGRDIGTVVLPEADAKFYVDAAADIRAKRRHLELSASGEEIEFSEVLSDLIKRDCRDKNRTVAPLNAADDAFFIDSSNKNAEEVLEIALSRLRDGELI